MEAEFIDWLRRRLPPHPRLHVGPGDDAAVMTLGDDGDVVITTDTIMDGVDFRLEECKPSRAGRKALAVNLSDLAAMAAVPVAAVVSLVLPRSGGRTLAEHLLTGMLPLAEKFDVAIAGGDTNSWDAPLAISITAIGKPASHGCWLRSGAQPGDQILVTGAFGGSILGKHFDFVPRVKEALKLNAEYEIHAAIDVSDGLSLDLNHIAEESACGAVLDLDAVPVSNAARELAKQQGGAALQHALGDGEDFELILAVPAVVAEQLLQRQPLDVPLTCVGQFVEEPGLWQSTASSERKPLTPSGFQHRLDE